MDEQIKELVRRLEDYSAARRLFRDEHANDYKGKACALAYDKQEIAFELVEDLLQEIARDRPIDLARALSAAAERV